MVGLHNTRFRFQSTHIMLLLFSALLAAVASSMNLSVDAIDASGVAAEVTSYVSSSATTSIVSASATLLPLTLAPDMNSSFVTVTVLSSFFEAFSARFDSLFESLSARIDNLSANLSARIDSLSTRVDNLSTRVDELSESVLTPVVSERVDHCSQKMVLFAVVTIKTIPIIVKQCSAVPVPALLAELVPFADAASSTFFLTSAHCFANTTDPANPVLLGDKAVVQIANSTGCVLIKQFLYIHPDDTGARTHIDVALVHCESPVPVPPPALSDLPYLANTRVALVGYSQGVHLNNSLSNFVTAMNITTSYALHTKHTRLTNSLQTPSTATAEELPVPPSRGYTEDSLAPIAAYAPVAAGSELPSGYVEASPWEGMSGGAVIDMRCGLVGITEGRAKHAFGGQFVRLTPDVLQLATRALSADVNGAMR